MELWQVRKLCFVKEMFCARLVSACILADTHSQSVSASPVTWHQHCIAKIKTFFYYYYYYYGFSVKLALNHVAGFIKFSSLSQIL